MQNGFVFDNIYVGHSEEDAAKLADETWAVKSEIEKNKEPEAPQESLSDTASGYLEEAKKRFASLQAEILEFSELAREDFVGTVKQMPHIAGLLVLGALLPLVFLSSLFSSSPAPKQTKKKESDEKSSPVKATATSSAVEQKEVKKRTAKKD